MRAEIRSSDLTRATAGWVAVVLEQADIITIDRQRPARVRLKSSQPDRTE